MNGGTASCPDRFTPYPLDRRLGGPQSRTRRCEEKNLAPAGIRIPAVQPYSPSLYRLSYTD
jgi:hypothetical protein